MKNIYYQININKKKCSEVQIHANSIKEVVFLINRVMGFNMVSENTIKNWNRKNKKKSKKYSFINITKLNRQT